MLQQELKNRNLPELKSREEMIEILQNEIGKVFADILGQCGVYDRNEDGKKQFLKFIDFVNN